MKVKAEHWVNYNGHWYAPGEEYECGSAVADTLEKNEPVEVKLESVQEKPQSVRRGRKKTNNE